MTGQQPPSGVDLRKWEQDPAGNWHRKSNRGRFIAWLLLALVVLGAGGWWYWDWKQEQDRVRDAGRDLTCEIVGGSAC